LRDFIVGTVIGMTPGVIVVCFFGNRLLKIVEEPTPLNIWIPLIFAVIGFFTLRALHRRLTAHPESTAH
jgi:uncharacterized membrane protein YdjX (TVP38/TMEM64 family)